MTVSNRILTIDLQLSACGWISLLVPGELMDVLPRFKRDTLIDGELDIWCTLPPIVYSSQS